MVVVNVLEPEVVLKDPREKVRLISLHWPRHTKSFGVIIGDFNIQELEEGRFSVRNQTFRR